MNKIRVAFGYEDKNDDKMEEHQLNARHVDPCEETNYTRVIVFEQRMLREINEEGIETLDHLME